MTEAAPEFSPEIENWISDEPPEFLINFYSLKIDRRKVAKVAVRHGLKTRDAVHDFWCHLEIAAKSYFDLREIREKWESGHKNISQREKIRREFEKIISGSREIQNFAAIFEPSPDPVHELLRVAYRKFEADLISSNSEFQKFGFATIDRDEFGQKRISQPAIPELMENREFREFICNLAFELLATGKGGRKAKTEIRGFAVAMIRFGHTRLNLEYEKSHELMDAVTPLEVFLKDCAELLGEGVWPTLKSFLIRNSSISH